MTSEYPSCDAQATAAAVTLLFDLRMRFSAEMPLAAWRMLANAESRLNRELADYFKPEANAPVVPPTGLSVQRHHRDPRIDENEHALSRR